MANSLNQLRSTAFSRQAGCCYYCGLPMWTTDPRSFADQHGLTLRQARLLQCTAEHLLPRQDGGRDSEANIAAACCHCNRTRHRRQSALDPERYRRLVQSRMAHQAWHNSRLHRAFLASASSVSVSATAAPDIRRSADPPRRRCHRPGPGPHPAGPGPRRLTPPDPPRSRSPAPT